MFPRRAWLLYSKVPKMICMVLGFNVLFNDVFSHDGKLTHANTITRMTAL